MVNHISIVCYVKINFTQWHSQGGTNWGTHPTKFVLYLTNFSAVVITLKVPLPLHTYVTLTYI